jgi:hypothetical protein
VLPSVHTEPVGVASHFSPAATINFCDVDPSIESGFSTCRLLAAYLSQARNFPPIMRWLAHEMDLGNSWQLWMKP